MEPSTMLNHSAAGPAYAAGRFPLDVPIAMASDTIASLQARLQELDDANTGIVNAADQAGEDLSDDELATIEANRAEIERVRRQIAAREAVKPAAGPGRRTPAEPGQATNGGAQRVEPRPRAADAGRGGFSNFGEFAIQVRAANRGTPDQRLLNAATTYGNEGTGADGGFAVPPDFRQSIWQKVMGGQENLLTRCTQLTTGSNSLVYPKDETTPWQTSGGVLAYWEGEAQAVTASKPQLTAATMRLNKLMALVPISEELMADAPGLDSWLRAKAPSKMVAKINTAIVSGTGVGQPLGVMNAGCLISVAKETSQPADTVRYANIVKMYSRMWAPSRRNAVWLINQDIEPQLYQMAFDPAATSKTPAYLPPGGLSDSPYATLMGRPVVPVEACSTLGDQGDIIFADLTEYWALTKGTGVQTDVSMHLYFDQGLEAFRFTFRVTGQPAWGSAIDPQNGNTTRSPFVTLDERG